MTHFPALCRFRLRTLLAAMLVLGGGLGWWLRPHTISHQWPSGQLQYELHVRRAWNGSLLTHGEQRWWWSNGQPARQGQSFGSALPEFYERLELADERRWDADGEPTSGGSFLIDWYVAQDLEEDSSIVDWSIYRFAETEHEP